MQKKQIISIWFPGVFMSIITIYTLSGLFKVDSVEAKGVFLFSLIIVFPVLFLLQGIICAITASGVVLNIGVSIGTYVALMLIYLNSSAIAYVFIYGIAWVIGYLLTKWIISIKCPSS